MPSPFPGMDPYLEDPDHWPSFHAKFISEIDTQLGGVLGDRYRSDIEKRVYILDDEDPGAQFVADLAIRTGGESTGDVKYEAASGGIAVMETWPLEVTEWYLAIRSSDASKVVTILEVLSPANKTHGSRGRIKYRSKRERILRSRTHLVEIDLLRAGKPPMPVKSPSSDYRLYVSKSDRRPQGKLWPFDLSDPLPSVPIPLLGSESVTLDVQSAFDATFRHGHYDRKLDYNGSPVPPLSPTQSKWAKKLLKARR